MSDRRIVHASPTMLTHCNYSGMVEKMMVCFTSRFILLIRSRRFDDTSSITSKRYAYDLLPSLTSPDALTQANGKADLRRAQEDGGERLCLSFILHGLLNQTTRCWRNSKRPTPKWISPRPRSPERWI